MVVKAANIGNGPQQDGCVGKEGRSNKKAETAASKRKIKKCREFVGFEVNKDND